MKSVIIDLYPAHAECLSLLNEHIDIDEAGWDFSLDVLQLAVDYQLMSVSKNVVKPSNTLELLEQQLEQTVGLDRSSRAIFLRRLTDEIIRNICRYLPDLRLAQVASVNWLTRTLVMITYETKDSGR